MKRTMLDSSAVISATYNAPAKVLDLQFSGGAVYRYYKVPATEYKRFMAAPSLGAYLNLNFKAKRYRYKKIS